MSLLDLFQRRPHDPRAMPLLLHLIQFRQEPELVWDAAFRARLQAYTDDQIRDLAGDAACLHWLGRAETKELLCAITIRQLDPDCLDPAFITLLKETK